MSEFELQDEIRKNKWKPIREFGFLYDFESWLNFTVYKHTDDEKHLYEEFWKR